MEDRHQHQYQHRSKQQPMQQQQQQQQAPVNWQPRPLPVAFAGYQMPLAPSQMFIPQPYYTPDYAAAYESMLGGYPSAFYAQQFPGTITTSPQQQQHQQQQQTQVDFQSCYGSYGQAVAAALQSSYPPLPAAFVGNTAAAPPQWSPAPSWGLNPPGDGLEYQSEGRSPGKLQRFGGGGAAQAGGGAGRGWKRNRDGGFQNNNNNNKRPGTSWHRNGNNFQGSSTNRPILRCEPCDRNFVGRLQMDAHMKTHTKCSVDGCSFEGIGKAVSEHRQAVHLKKPALNVSKENDEETKRWREARRKNYPTASNLQKKLLATQARVECGELVDDEALLRQESLKQILAKQAELGCQVAEIPPHYLSQRYAAGLGRPAKIQRTSDDLEGSRGLGFRRPGRKVCVFFQRGHCKKGRRCQFLHEAGAGAGAGVGDKVSEGKDDVQKREAASNARAETVQREREPTLLSKLLSSEIKRDKSHLLQCFRFLVKNEFLVDYPATPLNMFEWAEGEEDPAAAAPRTAPLLDDLDEEEEEDDDDGEDDLEQDGEEEVDDGDEEKIKRNKTRMTLNVFARSMNEV